MINDISLSMEKNSSICETVIHVRNILYTNTFLTGVEKIIAAINGNVI